jgi:hypothetical protein
MAASRRRRSAPRRARRLSSNGRVRSAPFTSCARSGRNSASARSSAAFSGGAAAGPRTSWRSSPWSPTAWRSPLSKLACHEHWLATRIYWPEADALTLDQLYFALDFLDTHSAAIEREVFFRTADLFNADVDLIFWDTTSVYFEVDDEDEHEETRRGTTLPPLRKRGHSKDRRDGDPQVVVGLALTRDGLPVRSWVFPGNTVDATTVAQVKADLRGWKLGRAIFVGDAGMDSEANRRELAKGLGHYILAMPLGKLKEVQEEVLARPGRFRVITDTLEVKEVVVGTGARRRRYIVCPDFDGAGTC